MRAILIAAALFAAAPAFAQATAGPTASATRAVLADASQAPRGRTIVDGANWRCEGTTCTTTGGAAQPAARACRRVKAKLGTLAEFAWKGEVLSAEQLAVCNA